MKRGTVFPKNLLQHTNSFDVLYVMSGRNFYSDSMIDPQTTQTEKLPKKDKEMKKR